MAQLTIYVPDHLADRVRAHRVQISRTCQRALERKVRLGERRLEQVGSIAYSRELDRRDAEARGGVLPS